MHLDWATLALQTVNFAILVWLLQRFLYRPILHMIDARKTEIARQFEQAQQREQETKRQLEQLQAQRAAIAAERSAVLQAAAGEAQHAAEARRAQAELDARTLLEAAQKSLGAERERALGELQDMALELGAEFARRLLAQIPAALRAEAWIERVEQHLQQLPASELQQLAAGAAAPAVSIVTASPLPPATVEAWGQRLARALGCSYATSFAVDPALIAGVQLHFPQAVLSFTWHDALAELRAGIEPPRAPH